MADQVNLRKEHKNPKGVMNNESKLIRTFATMTTEPQSNFDATAFAEAEESYILSTIGDSDDGDASAPESDEHVETNGPKPLTKAQVNNRKKLAVLVDQVVRHAKRHDIEFLSFFEGLNAPMEVKASCTPQLVRASVAHLAIVANKDFNEALVALREMFPAQDQPEPDETLPIVQTPEASDEAPMERGQDAG